MILHISTIIEQIIRRMCNYQIETSLIHDRSDSCMLPKIWNEWINKTFMDEQAQQHLATDEDGMCVFHSKHEEFKRINQSDTQLLSLIEFCNETAHIKIIDLRGVIIYTDKPVFSLQDLNLTKDLNLCNAVAFSPITISNCNFDSGVFLDNVQFISELIIQDSTFSGRFTAHDMTQFLGHVRMKEVVFADSFDIKDSYFKQQINLSGVRFENQAIFDGVQFAGENMYSHFNIIAHDYLSFDGSSFQGPVEFEKCEIAGEANFRHTYFEDRFHFTAPIVTGKVNFLGEDEEHPIFENPVEMVLYESSFRDAGQIVFENANLTALDGDTKAQLSELRQHNRVVLGRGTQVYKFIFYESYPYTAFNKLFLEDLLSKIRQYSDHNDINSFEFSMRKVDEDLIVTFFTDGYISELDFKSTQFRSVRDMIQSQVSDYTSQYLSLNMYSLVKQGVQAAFDEQLDKGILTQNIHVDTLILTAEHVNAIEARTMIISELSNSSIKVNLLNLKNDPKFDLSEEYFRLLKEQLSEGFDRNEELVSELSEKIREINNLSDPGTKYDQLVDFLGASGIAMARSVGGATIFHILKLLIN